MGVDCRDDVQQTSDDKELGAIIAERHRHAGLAQVAEFGNEVEETGTKLSDKAEDVQQLAVWMAEGRIQAVIDQALLSRLLRRQIPHKYLISLRGEVAEWSKAPDC